MIIGLDPFLPGFSSPDCAAFPGLTADKVMADIAAAEEGLRALGYDAQHCYVDFGRKAEGVVAAALQKNLFGCILIGGAPRAVPGHLILFDRLNDVIHGHAPHAKICFNTNPLDTLDDFRRWL